MSVGMVSPGSAAASVALGSHRSGEPIGAGLLADARVKSGPAPDASQQLYKRTVASLQRIADGLEHVRAAGAVPWIEQMIDPTDLEGVARMDVTLQQYKQRFPIGAPGPLNRTKLANDEAFRLKVELVSASIEFQRSMESLMSGAPLSGAAVPPKVAQAVDRVELAASRLIGVRQDISGLIDALRQQMRSSVPSDYL